MNFSISTLVNFAEIDLQALQQQQPNEDKYYSQFDEAVYRQDNWIRLISNPESLLQNLNIIFDNFVYSADENNDQAVDFWQTVVALSLKLANSPTSSPKLILEPFTSRSGGGTGPYTTDATKMVYVFVIPCGEWRILLRQSAFPSKNAAGEPIMKKQLVVELQRADAPAYHLGYTVCKVRRNEPENGRPMIEFGPAGPWPQHGVIDSAAGKAAMAILHYPAVF